MQRLSQRGRDAELDREKGEAEEDMQELDLGLMCHQFEDLCKAKLSIVCVFCIMKQVAVQVSKEHRTISKKTVMLIMALHFNKVKLFCNF